MLKRSITGENTVIINDNYCFMKMNKEGNDSVVSGKFSLKNEIKL